MLPRPPRPSLPQEAPWKEIEAIQKAASNLETAARAILLKLGIPTEVSVFNKLSPSVEPGGDAGIADAGTQSTLRDRKKYWMTNQWVGLPIRVVKPDQREYFAVITANTDADLTFAPAFQDPVEEGDFFAIFPLLNLPHKATFSSGSVQIAAAGTPVQLSSLAIPQGFPVSIIAQPANTGYIYLGKSSADVLSATARFNGLAAGLAVSLKITNLNAVWVDASVNGEGASWIVETDT